MKMGEKKVIIHPDGRYLQLDEFERELLQHYLKLSLETLKRRLSRVKSSTSKYLMEFAIDFRKQTILNSRQYQTIHIIGDKLESKQISISVESRGGPHQ